MPPAPWGSGRDVCEASRPTDLGVFVKAWLSDDRPLQDRSVQPTPGGWMVALDGETSTAPVWVGGGSATPSLPSDEWQLTAIAVRVRESAGYDDDGNSVYRWVTAYVGESVMPAGTRSEVDDLAGVVKRASSVEFSYPMDAVAITETAVVVDSGGGMWRVVQAVRTGSRYVLAIESP